MTTARVGTVADDTGHPHQILPSLPDRGYMGIRAHHSTELSGSPKYPVAPQPVGVPDLYLIIFDVQPYRLTSFPLNDDTVVTCRQLLL
jgi:hypothetical protein